MPNSDGETVLLVEDEEELAELFTLFLSADYTVRTATSGQEALEMANEEIDVVLLDRRMPEMSGGEVLAELVDRGIDSMFGMISGVDPDIEIVEMPFDDYLTKPVVKSEPVTFVERLIRRSTFDECSQEYFRLASKKAALESAGHDNPNEYYEIINRMDEIRENIDIALDSVAPGADPLRPESNH